MSKRAVSPVIAVILMVAVTVVIAAVISMFVLGLGVGGQAVAPQIAVSHELVDAGDEKLIAVTLTGGTSVSTDQLYVTASKDVDIGGSPDSGAPANDEYASPLEAFTESPDGTSPDEAQVDIGSEWDAGETIYLDPDGDAEEVTVRIYWNTQPIREINPGNVEGEDSYKIAEFTT
ncbi:MAG: type IV pilin N-terminal domain-containing protein [Halobacteriales archaeon]|nr:type IV pilin N-terminal domain-containing protein [Halobacteriales archaeon]